MTIRVKCGHCGGEFQAKPELAGKQGKCPKCGGTIVVPNQPAPSDTSRMASLLEGELSPTVGGKVPGPGTPEEPSSAEPKPSGRTCPSCGNVLPPNAVICVNCGFDVRSGKRLSTSHGGGPSEGEDQPSTGTDDAEMHAKIWKTSGTVAMIIVAASYYLGFRIDFFGLPPFITAAMLALVLASVLSEVIMGFTRGSKDHKKS